MAVKTFCIVTNSTEGRGAYGITCDGDESVYFPFSITEALELEEFEEVEAILVGNDRPDPKWKAIKVRRTAEE